MTRTTLATGFAFFCKPFWKPLAEAVRRSRGSWPCVRRSNKARLKLGKRAENARKLLDYLYKTPTVTVNEVTDVLGISPTAAMKLVREFESLEILKRKSMKSNRHQVFEFARYLDLFIKANLSQEVERSV